MPHTDHSSEQRAELVTLQRALLSLTKRFGSILCGLIVSGVVVGIADHYKLQGVENTVTELKAISTSEQTAGEQTTIWRVGVDAQILELRARVTNLEQTLKR